MSVPREDTGRGVALPLIVAAVICLVATCGTLVLAGGGSGHSSHRSNTVAATNDPQVDATQAADDASASPLPSDGSGAPGGSPSPVASSAGASPAQSPATPAPNTVVVTVTAPVQQQPQTVPRTQPSPQASTPPPPTAGPGDISVADVESSMGGGYMTLTNNSADPMPSWSLWVKLDYHENFTDISGPVGSTIGSHYATITSTSALAGHESVTFTWTIVGMTQPIACTLNGSTCNLTFTNY